MSDAQAKIRRAYSGASWRTRAHVAGRLATLDVGAVVAAVGSPGRVLDIGCGHGVVSLALALEGPVTSEIDGVDPDAAKIAHLVDAAARAGVAERLRARVIDSGWRPETAGCDAVVICDVLYLMGDAEAESLVGAAAAALAPGAVLVIAEVEPEPGWRGCAARLQELMAVRVLRLTRGSTVSFRTPDTYAGWMTDSGLLVERIDPPRRGLLRHVITVGRAAGTD